MVEERSAGGAITNPAFCTAAVCTPQGLSNTVRRKVVPVKTASCKEVQVGSGRLRSAPVSSAKVKLVNDASASTRSALHKRAPLTSARNNQAQLRIAPVRSTSLRWAEVVMLRTLVSPVASTKGFVELPHHSRRWRDRKFKRLYSRRPLWRSNSAMSLWPPAVAACNGVQPL
jgi:hypothetical protein